MIEQDEFHALIREDLHAFIVWALTVLNPGSADFQDNWHIHAIVHHLMKCYRGEIMRLLITLPPRSLKSHCISIAFVAWVLGHQPGKKFICASYGEKPADLLADQTRALMNHLDYLKAFPETRFGGNAPLDMLTTTANGYRMSTSVGGAATGIGCDFVIADDLTKAETTAAERAKATSFYQTSLLSRFNKKSEGVAIVVAQRTAVDDLPGFLLDRGGYVHLNLPAIAQADEKIEVGDGAFHIFHKGELLHEARENAETLKLIRRDIGDNNFNAQFLQQPNAHCGAILNPDWFPRYAEACPRDEYARRVLSIDTAMTTEVTSDYSAVSVYGGAGRDYDLLHVWRDRVTYGMLMAKIDALIKEWKPTHIIIERANVGFSLLQYLAARFQTGLIGFSATISKEERLARLLNYFQQGHIRLPQAAPWLAAFNNEVFSFPSSAHDDQLDTLVQFANKADISFQGCPAISWEPPVIRRVDELHERYGRYVVG